MKLVLIAFSILFIFSCAHHEAVSPASRQWFKQVRDGLDPVWRAKVHEGLKELSDKGYRIATKPPYTIKVVIYTYVDGVIKRVELLEKSKVEMLNEVTMDTLKNLGRLPNPPDELIKNNEVKVRWDFVFTN